MSRRRARLEASAIQPLFAKRLDLIGQMREAVFLSDDGAWTDPRALQRRYLLPALAAAGAGWHVLGSAFGLAGLDPTIDRRLLEYCMGVPVEQFARDGRTRWLYRRAMEGLLPPGAQWNTRRGLQAADLGHRLVATRDEVEASLREVEASSITGDYVDLARMRAVWNDLLREVNPRTTHQSHTILLRGLAAALFLVAMDIGPSYYPDGPANARGTR
jgi:asparagine synthase (glutamine-hydrolysing)